MQQLAYQYARRGASLSLVARREQALKAVAKTARDLGAPDVIALPADISSAEEAKRIVNETITHFGQRDDAALLLSQFWILKMLYGL